jgi:cysteinyl-tRNA synthetase
MPGTRIGFDRVLGLQLGAWQAVEAIVPAAIAEFVQPRQQARVEKRWQDADALVRRS